MSTIDRFEIPTQLLDAIGWAADEVVTVRATEPTPDQHVGHGLAVDHRTTDDLVARFRASASRTAVSDAVKGSLPQGVDVLRWGADPAVVSVRGAISGMNFIGTVHRIGPREILADPSEAPVVGVFGDHAENLLVLGKDGITVLSRDSRASHEMHALIDWRPPAALVFEPMDIASVLAAFVIPVWLASTARTLIGSPSVVSRVAAAGLVARLWTPDTTPGLSAAVALALASADSPRLRAVRWFGSLDARVRFEVMRAAESEATMLEDRLAALEDLAARGDPNSADSALAWLHRRDDLESVAELARATQDADGLDAALADLDDVTALRHTLWAAVPGIDRDERLLAVAWQEPERWWGALAVS